MQSILEDNIALEISNLDKKEIASKVIAWAIRHNYPVALWRLPNSSEIISVGFNEMTSLEEPEVETLPKGFIFSSYEGKNWFINADLTINLDTKQVSTNPIAQSTSIAIDFSDSPEQISFPNTGKINIPTTKQEFIAMVEKCIDHIKNNNLLKIVPTKVKHVDIPKSFDPINYFFTLSKNYTNSCVSMVCSKQVGTWIGTSPEILISMDKPGIFKTMALAGTQNKNDSVALHNVPWTQKEIEEQALVSRYIVNRFKEIRLREFEEVGPRTIQAANLVHLSTYFTVDTVATNFPNLGSVMLKLLHPTSAVCGMPKKPAHNLLSKIEKHDRKFYSGFLGPIKHQSKTNIYVNLRCMELIDKKAVLYSGAGVTAYSIPEKEWEETELKCKTLLNLMDF